MYVHACKGGMCVLVHSLGFCRLKFWTYLRTRTIRFSLAYNYAILCVVYPIAAVKVIMTL